MSTKELDIRAQEMQKQFLKEAVELARSYEQAGELEKSKTMLRTLLKLDPKLPGVDAKIKEIDSQILGANETDMEIDTSGGWGDPRGRVFKGKAFKVQADGTYRFMITTTIDANGFPSADPVKDMAAGIPCGALMGFIMTGNKKKPGKPFVIGASKTITPKEDGLLFLRVNVPPGHKCTGRIKVRLSGNVAASTGAK